MISLQYKYFNTFFKKDIFVGQMRTRLGIPGYEITGPELAARELLNTFNTNKAPHRNRNN